MSPSVHTECDPAGEERGGPWDSHPNSSHSGRVCDLVPGANRAWPRAGLSGVAHGSQQSSPPRMSGHSRPAEKVGLDLPMA